MTFFFGIIVFILTFPFMLVGAICNIMYSGYKAGFHWMNQFITTWVLGD